MKLLQRPILPESKGLDPHPVGGRGSWLGGMGGAPVAFSAQTTAAVAPGANTPLNVGTLQLGFRSGYWVDEIRMNAWATGGGLTPSNNGLAAFTSFHFQTGTKAFSKGAVPMGLYAPIFSQFDYGAEQTVSPGGYISFARTRWKLPKPLFMNPGDAIQCSVFVGNTFLTNAQNLSVNASVTYIGRALAQGAKPPVSRQVPWLGWFQKDSDTAFASCTNELQNPFTSRLIVQRFTSRTFVNAAGTAFGEQQSAAQLQNGANDPYCEMHLDDSLGYQIVPKFHGVGMVFDTSRHAWTFSRTMGPREQFNLQLRNAGGAIVRKFQTQVGMVGYRDEEV
jgi:hypothetical protein